MKDSDHDNDNNGDNDDDIIEGGNDDNDDVEGLNIYDAGDVTANDAMVAAAAYHDGEGGGDADDSVACAFFLL